MQTMYTSRVSEALCRQCNSALACVRVHSRACVHGWFHALQFECIDCYASVMHMLPFMGRSFILHSDRGSVAAPAA